VTWLRSEKSGVGIQAGTRHFLPNVQTGNGSETGSYSQETGSLFPDGVSTGERGKGVRENGMLRMTHCQGQV
jgi:hypothetical protein